MILIAKFEINLPAPLIFCRPEDDLLVYELTEGEFNVKIKFLASQSLGKSKMSGAQFYTYCITAIHIWVSREESESLPPIIERENGIKDHSIRSPFFNKILPSYKSIARKIFVRIIKFFKYELRVPFLHEESVRREDFANAVWFDADGAELGSGTITIFMLPTFGKDKNIGTQPFTRELDSNFSEMLKSEREIELHYQLLLDAQDAIYEENFRRAVLEIAISIELVTKRFFFSHVTIAGQAFDWLEDGGKVTVKVLELIDKASLEIFGKSFKAQHANVYVDIDMIFRCRNKVAHRGVLKYRDDHAVVHQVDWATLSKWWNSAHFLVKWLEKLGNSADPDDA